MHFNLSMSKIGMTTSTRMNGIDEEDGGLTLPVPEGVEFLPRKVGHEVPCRSWESRPGIIFDGENSCGRVQEVDRSGIGWEARLSPRTRSLLDKTGRFQFCGARSNG